MLNKVIVSAAVAALAALLTPAEVGAYGGAHAGATSVGTGGAAQTGGTSQGGATAVSVSGGVSGGSVYNPSTQTRVYGGYDYHPNVYPGGTQGSQNYQYDPRYYGGAGYRRDRYGHIR